MGGGNLTSRLCTLPKGGAARDREKYGSPMPVPRGGLLTNREPHTSSRELARHKLGAGEGAYAVGCQRRIPRKQRGRRGTARADTKGNSISCAHHERMDYWNRGQRRKYWDYGERISSNLQQFQSNHQGYGWRSAAQQSATVSCGICLEADGVISAPGKGWAA